MKERKLNYERLKKFVLGQGISVFGVADITKIRKDFLLDEELKNKFNRALSLGKRLIDPIIEDIKDRPTRLYFHHYRQLNFFLDRAALLVSSLIQEHEFHALPIPTSQIIDWKNQKAHLSHKKIGCLAGLGWMGRNNLLINPKLGARFRLVTVLTDMPLEADVPLKENCVECRRCLKVCPVHAIKEQREDFNHWACFEKLKEFKKIGIVGQHICGICVKACPGFSKK